MFSFIRSRSFTAPLLVILLVFAANFLYITTISSPNPINTRSGLLISVEGGFLKQGDDTIDPNDGFTTQALGHLAAKDIIHGHLPLWNSDEQVGAPLLGGMQSAALLPITVLMIFASGVLYFHIALELIAALSMFYLLKKLGCKDLPSILGATVFGLSSIFAWFGASNVNPVPFLPLLVLGIELSIDNTVKNKRDLGFIIIPIAIALSVYAGFPEIAYLDGLVAFSWALVRIFQTPRTHTWKVIRKLIYGAILGVMLAAPIIVSFIDYLPYANVGPHSGPITAALPNIGIPALLMPYLYGPIFGFNIYGNDGTLTTWWSTVGGYLTILVLFLAVMSLFVKEKLTQKSKSIKYLLFIWMIVIICRIYGFPGLAQIIDKFPGLGITALYRYGQPVAIFAASVLLSFFVNYLLVVNKSKKKNLAKPVALVSLLFIGVIVSVIPLALTEYGRILGAPHLRIWFFGSIAWAAISVIAAATLLLINEKYAHYLLVGLVMVETIFMFSLPELSANRQSTIDLKPVVYLKQNIGLDRFYSIGRILPNYSSYFGIASINTNDLPIAKNWSNYVNSNLDSNTSPLTFTGLNPTNPEGISPLSAFFKNIKSYEYVGVKYLVLSSALEPSQISQANIHLVFDDTSTFIYRLPSTDPYYTVENGDCSLTNETNQSLVANCKYPSKILRRELYMKGWEAKANGNPLRVIRSGPLFQSIKLPKGESVVEFKYQPSHIAEAIALYIVATITTLSYIVYIFHDELLKTIGVGKKWKK